MAVSGRVTSVGIGVPTIDRSRSTNLANATLQAHATQGVKPAPAKSPRGTGRSTGPVVAGSIRLSGGTI